MFSNMSYAIQDIDQDQQIIWQWLEEASGCTREELLAAIQEASYLSTQMTRSKLFYLYTLFHELQMRQVTDDIPVWLRTSLQYDFSQDIAYWDMKESKKQYYYAHYLPSAETSVESEVKEEVEEAENSLADNPFRKMAEALDGRTPLELLYAGEWGVVWNVIVKSPQRHPYLYGFWNGHWSVAGWRVPYTSESNWEPNNPWVSYGDDPWELESEARYEEIEAKLQELFLAPYQNEEDDNWSWSQERLEREVETLAGVPLSIIADTHHYNEQPGEEQHGDYWLIARYIFLCALTERDVDVYAWLRGNQQWVLEPKEYLSGKSPELSMSALEMMRQDRWTALWQALEDLPYKELPRLQLGAGLFIWDNKMSLSDYPEKYILDLDGTKFHVASQSLQEQIMEEYPLLKRLFGDEK